MLRKDIFHKITFFSRYEIEYFGGEQVHGGIDKIITVLVLMILFSQKSCNLAFFIDTDKITVIRMIIWMHSECHSAWIARRRAAAAQALVELGIRRESQSVR